MLPMNRRNAVAALVVLAVGAVAGYITRQPQDTSPHVAQPGAEAVLAAFAARRSDQWLEAGGVVARTLPDDKQGDRHQRFILNVNSNHSVLVAHNIDLAPRVPLSAGDSVTLRGEYEWNDKGGVIHWTHHDPRGRHEGGWIRHDGKTYR